MTDDDPIIHMSPVQLELRLAKLRKELEPQGYSIVKTEWLDFLTWHNQQHSKQRRTTTLAEGV